MPGEVPHWGVDIEGRPAVWLKGTDVVEVVGESQYQQHLYQVAGPPQGKSHQVEVAAWLVPQPHPQDPNAVQVYIGGGLVGYVPPAHARLWQPVIVGLSQRYGRGVACFAKVVGGMRRATMDGEGGYYAVRLFLPPAPL